MKRAIAALVVVSLAAVSMAEQLDANWTKKTIIDDITHDESYRLCVFDASDSQKSACFQSSDAVVYIKDKGNRPDYGAAIPTGGYVVDVRFEGVDGKVEIAKYLSTATDTTGAALGLSGEQAKDFMTKTMKSKRTTVRFMGMHGYAVLNFIGVKK